MKKKNLEQKNSKYNKVKINYTSKINVNKIQLTNDLIDRTIDDCNRSVETIDAVMECLHELNNLLLKHAIWSKNNLDKNKIN